MYSRSAWGGPVDPFILIKFLPVTTDADPIVSMVIFEWKDENFIGVLPSPDAQQVCIYVMYTLRRSADASFRKSESANRNTSPIIATKLILESTS